jgi:outer membrane receptor for ferrienterochelin and colicin
MTFTGSLSAPGGFSVSNYPTHGRGAFLQGQLGLWDALFLTYGVRGEWNPAFGADINPNLAPRYGVAFTREFGNLTAKLRGSYGRSTRPPTLGLQQGISIANGPYGNWVPYYGDVFYQFPNLNLLPEDKQGGEGGLELYLGSRASLVVTRFNETVDNLITSAIVDSVDLVAAFKQGHGIPDWKYPLRQTENLNLGSVRNQGWELQGTVTTGSVTTKGTYSWTKSRLIGITPKFHKQFPQYVVGSPFDFIPEHTYAIDVTYAHGGTTVSTNWQGEGQVFVGTSDRLYAFDRDARLPLQNTARWELPSNYHGVIPGYPIGDLNISQRLTTHLDANAQISNIASRFQNDYNQSFGSIGRTMRVGLRLRF